VKELKAKFSPHDIEEIFFECDEEEKSKISIAELSEICARTVSRARALCMKFRTAVMKVANNESEYRREFNSFKGAGKFADLNPFAEYVEEMLNAAISDTDALEMSQIIDMDGDGQLSADDFVGFILGQSTDAYRALEIGNPDVIVDVKVSTNSAQDAELTRAGYTQLQAFGAHLDVGSQGGTFGRGESLWAWKRKQGTCSGRLKPVVDIQLTHQAMSSAMVLSGYTRITESVGGQWAWIKRATTMEEEKDALLDLHVTLGKSARVNPTNPTRVL
jgi:Ca2+-binding EF-hand superfamily protein